MAISETLELKRLLARRDFFLFCQLMAPEFYKSDRAYLIKICEDLQDFINSPDNVLVLNVPPRHGKSRTLSLFSAWLFGRSRETKIMTGSYNERLAVQFAKGVRNTIATEKGDENITVFNDIFPETRIAYGEASMNLWSLEGGYQNYLATSPTGTATGFGASLIIIDDLIKSSMDALNDNTLEGHYEWFNNTMLSRLESGGKVIIVMTRWSSKDLAGRVLKEMPEHGFKVNHINMKAYENGRMLCDDILTKTQFDRLSKTMLPEIASANYQQKPIDLEGGLYKQFKTYESMPEFVKIWNYTDTADTGTDFHTSIVFGQTHAGEAYILDVIHTQKDMTYTEVAEAKQLDEYNVNVARIESNNGGEGFARQVKRSISNHVIIKTFHQSKNKEARIYSNAAWIQEHVYYPSNWADRWPSYYEAMKTYQAQGKNKHDDAPDATTGIAETLNKPRVRF